MILGVTSQLAARTEPDPKVTRDAGQVTACSGRSTADWPDISRSTLIRKGEGHDTTTSQTVMFRCFSFAAEQYCPMVVCKYRGGDSNHMAQKKRST